MDKPSFEFLSDLLATPSVSGFEQPAARVVRKWLQGHADDIRSDVHGNTFFVLNPKGSPRIMLAAHIDQIGFLVNHVTAEGYRVEREAKGRYREIFTKEIITSGDPDAP